ncbi:MAG: hypothetical protein ACXWDI_10365 [Nocardioides sp.]
MNRSTITRLASSTVVAGVAGLALAAPASAMEAPDPAGGLGPATPTAVSESDDPWMEIGIGALAGLAIAGVGVAAAQTIRHRSPATTS